MGEKYTQPIVSVNGIYGFNDLNICIELYIEAELRTSKNFTYSKNINEIYKLQLNKFHHLEVKY